MAKHTHIVKAQFNTINIELIDIKIEPIDIKFKSTSYANEKKINKIKLITLEHGNFMSIVGPINRNNVGVWIRNMSSIEHNNFYVYIDSNGGSVDAGQKLIDQFSYLQQKGVIIECIVQNAHSMAFQILQSCDKRYITPSAKVMQHQMSLSEIDGQFDNLMNYLTMIQQMSNKLDKVAAERIGISYDDYKKKVATDWWLFGEEIIRANVADEIVYIGCSPNLYSSYKSKDELELIISANGFFTKISKSNVDLCPL